MTRRELIKYTSLMTGAALTGPALLSLSGCKSEVAENYIPTFFKAEELDYFSLLADLIIPKSDSPSASDMKVPERIDKVITNNFNAEQQEDYKDKFTALCTLLDGNTSTFKDKSLESQTKRLSQLDKEGYSEKGNKAHHGLHTLKQQVISFYLSSEEVMTKHLNYLPIPGEFKGCISLEETGGKAWAI